MIYENKEAALKSREKIIIIPKDDPNRAVFNKHCEKWQFYKMHDKLNHRRFGVYFLYELEEHSSELGTKLHYPKLGLYINELPCDQTTEVEWIDYRPRTWEWKTEYKYTYDGKEYTNYMSEIPTEINRTPIWFDDILVYGAWNSMPNWKQLKQAYERTWWFYRTEEEKRDIQLNRLLK
jgi:hypothetical protein